MKDTTLAELEKEFLAAEQNYADASQRASQARTEETNAMNALNRAQQAIDAHMAVLRKRSPSNSDWKRGENRGSPT